MNVKVKYLNWDKEGNDNLVLGLLRGKVFGDDDYRFVIEFNLANAVEVDNMLNNVYELMNRIDERPCYVPENERSMCVGDLIYLNDKVYVVDTIGFKSCKLIA